MVQPDRPHITIWRLGIACWIPKATDKRSEYEIFIACPLQQWLREDASMLRYTDIELHVFHLEVLVKQYRDYKIPYCYSNYCVSIGDPTVHLTTLLIGSVLFEGLKMTR